jgi:hypothetical protein
VYANAVVAVGDSSVQIPAGVVARSALHEASSRCSNNDSSSSNILIR